MAKLCGGYFKNNFFQICQWEIVSDSTIPQGRVLNVMQLHSNSVLCVKFIRRRYKIRQRGVWFYDSRAYKKWFSICQSVSRAARMWILRLNTTLENTCVSVRDVE